MQLRHKRFDRPDEVRIVEKARVELIELGELAVGRAIFEPGWRWSDHVKPIVGTESCQVHHLGYVLSGHLHIEMTDGASLEVMGGDAFEIPPGHDAWVIGDEPWISVDWAGRRLFAKSPKEISDRIFTTLVFTDLCGSTETLNRLGDARWRLLLAEHNQAVRAEIERFGGREAKTTGDGFFVLFDSPARAVRGAAAMIDAAADSRPHRSRRNPRWRSRASRRGGTRHRGSCRCAHSRCGAAWRGAGVHHHPRSARRFGPRLRRSRRVRAARPQRIPQLGGAGP